MTKLYHYTLCGLDNVWLANGYHIEPTAYGEAVRIEGSEALDRAIAEAILQSHAPLSGKELRFLRQLIGLSQPDVGALTGKDAQSVARWEKSGIVEATAERLIRIIFSSHFNGNETVRNVIAHIKLIDRTINERIILTQEQGNWTPSVDQQPA